MNVLELSSPKGSVKQRVMAGTFIAMYWKCSPNRTGSPAKNNVSLAANGLPRLNLIASAFDLFIVSRHEISGETHDSLENDFSRI